MAAAGKQEGEDKIHDEKGETSGTNSYKCRERKENRFPREPRVERFSGTAEAMDLQRGAKRSQ